AVSHPNMITGPAFGMWMRNLAIGGAVLGALVGVLRGVAGHLPSSALGTIALRFGVAGAAAGASLMPALRAATFVVKGFVWFALALVLWWIMMAAAGNTAWLERLKP